MKKNYITLMLLCIGLSVYSQVETFTISGYDGTSQTITATTATVNDNITIIFEDLDVINNFYTENRTFIHLYGGLRTNNGSYQGVPYTFNDLSSQPMATIEPGDNTATSPNSYSLTINLTDAYNSTIADGTTVLGLDFLFQNEFGGGGNNQTVDLYIDLIDAMKDSSTLGIETLNISDITFNNFIQNKILSLKSNKKIENVSIFNILGQNVFSKKYHNENEINISLQNNKIGIYIIKAEIEGQIKTFKTVLN